MNIRLKNDLIRSIHNFEERRSTWPTLGRKRKLNTAQILDRILYVCKTRANGVIYLCSRVSEPPETRVIFVGIARVSMAIQGLLAAE